MQGKDVTTEIGTCLISPLKRCHWWKTNYSVQSHGKMRGSQRCDHLNHTELKHMGFLAEKADKGSAHQSAKCRVCSGQEIGAQKRVNVENTQSGQQDSLKRWNPRQGERKSRRRIKNKRKMSSGFCWRELVWKGKVQTTALQSRLTLAFPQETREVREHTLTRRFGL